MSRRESASQIKMRAGASRDASGRILYLCGDKLRRYRCASGSLETRLCHYRLHQTMTHPASKWGCWKCVSCSMRRQLRDTTGKAQSDCHLYRGSRDKEHWGHVCWNIWWIPFFISKDKHHFRVLRSVKNRFGSTNEIGVFEMHQEGLNSNQPFRGLLRRTFGWSNRFGDRRILKGQGQF